MSQLQSETRVNPEKGCTAKRRELTRRNAKALFNYSNSHKKGESSIKFALCHQHEA